MSFVFHDEPHLPCVPNCWWHCRSGCRRRNKLKGVSAVNKRVHFIIISTRGCPSITLRSSIHPRGDARGGFKGMTGLGRRVALAKANALIWILQHVCAINEAKILWRDRSRLVDYERAREGSSSELLKNSRRDCKRQNYMSTSKVYINYTYRKMLYCDLQYPSSCLLFSFCFYYAQQMASS